MIYTLTTADAPYDFWLFINAIFRYQDRDWLADGFFRLIADSRSAPPFQLVMMPLRSLLTIAS